VIHQYQQTCVHLESENKNMGLVNVNLEDKNHQLVLQIEALQRDLHEIEDRISNSLEI
jgi:hypothetical protein